VINKDEISHHFILVVMDKNPIFVKVLKNFSSESRKAAI